MAEDLFNVPEKIIPDSKNNEIYYIRGNDLLRVDKNGEFVSLYPGAKSQRVIDALKSAK